MKMLTSKTRGPKRRQDRVSHGQISFGDLARTIAAKWKAIDPKLKAIYNHYAAQEKVRYKKEVVIWKEKKEREHEAARAAKQRSMNNNSSSYNDSMMSLSSSVTSTLSTSMSTAYNLSESHNSIQGSLGMQSPDVDVVQRQQDILRQQMGFIDSKPQARTDGNDNDSRILPKRGSNESDDMQFPRSMGGSGNANAMSMNMMSMNRNALQKEQMLLQLQHQQLQQLRQLQQVRNETSRLSNMRTTDTFMNMAGNQFGGRGLSGHGNPRHLMEQYKQLDDITAELELLKQQERQMQQKIREHQSQSMWQDNASFGNMFNNGNYNEYTAGLNDSRFGSASMQASFDLEDRQRAMRRSMSNDMDLFRGRGNGGFNSAPSSFNYGKKFGADGLHGMMGGANQQQQSGGRRDSLAALLNIDDARDQRRQNQQQSQQNEGNGSQQDLGSLFNNADV